MELVEVEILTQTITQRYGVLSQGDILRTDAAFARHLVKESFSGKYVNPKDDVEPTTDTVADGPKPSDGLTVTELKAALEGKGIPIPEGAKKPDLVALLDGAA
ncbi:HeH/LEM domain-containing protein [Variovorax boronicumulans]|uniref:HeH/LEM domain-containing protein n=1 Tax=Variovorax boronicumulans TaxID=436515 RepID=UPI00278608DE|nr:HeH/LEM domain-containing protein [Variovorax boronicumulans]MDQ0040823.1 hypothetical protein [Variovorax boronicumulans]